VTVTVPSFAKINLGLRIGPLRADGFHELRTVYQTIALHDMVKVSVGRGSGIEVRCTDPRVPKDETNTCWKIVDRAMQALKARGRVVIEIEKRLPVQGGLGGASGNAVAALLALERALQKKLPVAGRLRIAAQVGSDIPLFLVGGTVLGVGRGEEVYPLPDLRAMPCVIALPDVAISTPKAFADWDRTCGAGALAREETSGNLDAVGISKIEGATVLGKTSTSGKGTASSRDEQSRRERAAEGAELRSAWTVEGARPHMAEAPHIGNARNLVRDDARAELTVPARSDRMLKFSREISAWLNAVPITGGRRSGVSASGGGRAENPLLDLVRTGIENDFERVVFPKYPELLEVKRVLEKAGAVYASLSGSGSAIYGLFDSKKEAAAAARKLAQSGTRAVVTSTLTRRQYWKKL
jgi:4-diphosphocytidyl-2-C-methyl-D-erythritol kinase